MVLCAEQVGGAVLDIKEGKLCVVSKLVCNDIPNKMLHYLVEDQDYVAIGNTAPHAPPPTHWLTIR